MPLHIEQIPLFTAICRELEAQSKVQTKPAVINTRQVNTIIKACDDIIAALATDDNADSSPPLFPASDH